MEDEYDWERDRVALRNGKERRGVVIEACDPEHVVLLVDGGRREEFPLEDVERVDKLRDRLKSLPRSTGRPSRLPLTVLFRIGVANS